MSDFGKKLIMFGIAAVLLFVIGAAITWFKVNSYDEGELIMNTAQAALSAVLVVFLAQLRSVFGVFILAATLLVASNAEAQTPWHLQPMDTWHDGECYRSPHAGGGESLTVDTPAVAFSVGDLVTADDLPGQVFSIADKEAWHHFKDGRAAHAYYAKDIQTQRGCWLPTSRLVPMPAAKLPTDHWLNGGPILTPTDVSSAYGGLANVLEAVIAEAKAGKPDNLRAVLRNMGHSEEEIEKAIAHVMGKPAKKSAYDKSKEAEAAIGDALPTHPFFDGSSYTDWDENGDSSIDKSYAVYYETIAKWKAAYDREQARKAKKNRK